MSFKAKIVESYEVQCCDVKKSFEWKHEAVDYLMGHIRRKHKNLLPTLEKKGRDLARSQNGCGYYDGSDKDTGWPRAQASFREAWRKHALERMLRFSNEKTN